MTLCGCSGICVRYRAGRNMKYGTQKFRCSSCGEYLMVGCTVVTNTGRYCMCCGGKVRTRKKTSWKVKIAQKEIKVVQK